MAIAPAVRRELVDAWSEWERVAANPPRHPSAQWLAPQAARKEAALVATGLPATALHRAISDRRRPGLSVEASVDGALADGH